MFILTLLLLFFPFQKSEWSFNLIDIFINELFLWCWLLSFKYLYDSNPRGVCVYPWMKFTWIHLNIYSYINCQMANVKYSKCTFPPFRIRYIELCHVSSNTAWCLNHQIYLNELMLIACANVLEAIQKQIAHGWWNQDVIVWI